MASQFRDLDGGGWVKNGLQRLVATAGRVLFPHFCLACSIEDRLLCNNCKMRYALNQGVLFSLPFKIGSVRCFSVGHYADRVLQRLLQLYKYEQIEEAGEILLEIFLHTVGRQISAILAGLDNPVVVPVPMHPINYSRRGFNQAEVLARYLAADFELELDKKTLCRRFSWRPQARVFNTEQRVKNVSRVFFAKNNSLFDREILLIDDVFTTGATITDCLRALQLEESNKITIITMLKG